MHGNGDGKSDARLKKRLTGGSHLSMRGREGEVAWAGSLARRRKAAERGMWAKRGKRPRCARDRERKEGVAERWAQGSKR